MDTNKEDKLITFDDGYRVIVNSNAGVSVEFNGKMSGGAVHASHFGDVLVGSQAMGMLEKKGLDPDDYILAVVSGREVMLRGSNGVREMVTNAAEDSKKVCDDRNAVWEAERQERQRRIFEASGFDQPVFVSIKDSDGWPLGVIVGEGRDYISPKDWTDVFQSEGCSVMNQDAYDALLYQYKAKEDAKKAEALRIDEAIKVRRQKALDEALEIGKPVIYRKFMTDRCMNGNGCECSIDSAVKYAMPNGTFKTTYSCCY